MNTPRKTTTADGFLRGARPDRSLARRLAFLVGGAFFVSVLALTLVGENGLGAWFRLHGQQEQLRGEVADLERTNAGLEQQLDDLAADPAFLEKIAREEYNLQQPDEEVLLIVPARPDDGSKAD